MLKQKIADGDEAHGVATGCHERAVSIGTVRGSVFYSATTGSFSLTTKGAKPLHRVHGM